VSSFDTFTSCVIPRAVSASRSLAASWDAGNITPGRVSCRYRRYEPRHRQEDRAADPVLPRLTGSHDPPVGGRASTHLHLSEMRVVPRDSPPRPMTGPPNELWNGQPERLSDGFTMTKPESSRTHVAACEVWTNPAGWELRLITDGHSLIATVVQSAGEMHVLIEMWRAALLKMGWS
jgi:hypothetical protein